MEIAELEVVLQSADPAALLVPNRILRRVIKRDRKPAVFGLQVPHRKSHVIARDRLLRFVDRDEIGLPADADLPPVLFLIGRPDPDRLARLPRSQSLIRYWQLLFHCRVHAAFNQLVADGKLTEVDVRRRIHQIGHAEFTEIRQVLRQEKFLLPPPGDLTAYGEFAAVYLELRHFAPNTLPCYFPAIDDFERVDAALAQDLDAENLFASTRLAGAPDPVLASVSGALQSAHDLAPPAGPPEARVPSENRCRRYLARADRALQVGNAVRSAILRKAAEQVAPAPLETEIRGQAEEALDRLIHRLQAALELTTAEAEEWCTALKPLLQAAAQGIWPVEARLLYDLQRVCIDHERGVYAVDVVEWALWLGKRPIKRPLPNQQEVLMLKHLRKAARRLARARLPDPERHQLASLLRSAVHRRQVRLRGRLRPVIQGALDKVGLRPNNVPERVARDKLVEELLDRITAQGYFNIGHLRDAISRNNLKLADLSGPGEFFRGDPLLRLDHEFAFVLDGIYRRGEVYMRWLQRFSSLAFGTRPGRFLTRYLALPFGGAFVLLEGLQHLLSLVTKLFGYELEFANAITIGLFGVFLLGLFHVRPFRQRIGQTLGLVFKGFRGLFVDLPAAVVQLPAVQRLLNSPPVAFFDRYLLTPLVVAGLAALVFLIAGSGGGTLWTASGVTFLVAVVLFNSRLGRNAEEALTDWAIRNWEHVRTGILPGLLRFIIDFFHWLIEMVERLLYTVDEWLRFKSGEGRVSLVVKATLGVVWFYVTYIIRFCFNLLIEPQINPIKHFPVVTVSHKLLLPTIPSVTTVFEATMGLDHAKAFGVATTVVTSIPGMFGFLVWELKENWKLYQANRSPELKPVAIGHHGETMLRLMKPGFHSGTLPKLFARLRKAERRATKRRNWSAVHHQLEAKHHIEVALQQLVERELLPLLRGSKNWGGLEVEAGDVAVGSNRVRIEVCCPTLASESLLVAFEEQAGWLVAGLARGGWLPRLSRGQAQTLGTALAGLYKMAGVHLVREQIENCLEGSPSYDVTSEGLIVWPGGRFDSEVVYELNPEAEIHPRLRPPGTTGELPVLEAGSLLYQRVPITWERWVETWQADESGCAIVKELVEGVCILPPMGERKRGEVGPAMAKEKQTLSKEP
jgi:hypothetical protein